MLIICWLVSKGVNMQITTFVGDIDPANKSLAFIDYRLSFNSYRGMESSQHNRYQIDDVYNILKLLNQIRPNKNLLQIRVGDSKDRPNNLPAERDYAEFCKNAKKLTGRGTQDAMRKNFFVDWDRIGLIHRYDINKRLVPPFSRKAIHYVSMSDIGLQFIREPNLVHRNFMFSKLLNEFLKGFVQSTLNVITTTNLDYITFDELMFFVSAIDHPEYGIKTQECEELITEYRALTRIQKKATIDELKKKLEPKLFEGNKTVQRDYDNWKNKYVQIWGLFKDLPFFIIDEATKTNGKLYLTTSNYTAEKYSRKDMNRSPQAKVDYFTNHQVNKTHGFELDHIIPLLIAENVQEFHYLDDWQNLLYIDGKTHAIKSQKGSNHMILSQDLSNDNILYLSDTSDDTLSVMNGSEGLFNTKFVQKMVNYNSDFLNHIETKV